MKFMACIVLALAVCAYATEEPEKDKRATFALGYGAYPYSYGAYPYNYGAYPYAGGYKGYPYATPYYGSPFAYTSVVPAKTEVITEKVVAKTPASTVLPYSTFGAYPYSYGAYPYSGYNYGAYPYAYSGYPYYGFAGKLIK